MDQVLAFQRRLGNVLESLVPPPGGRAAAALRHLRSRLWLVAALTVAAFVYVYFVSAGRFTDWPVYGTYHDLQADGFLSGHTYLPVEPAPELVHAADPYDRVNIRYWWLDLSYYRGKYYIYWGPTPALLQALGKALLGVHRVVGDQYVGFFSACLACLSGALLIERLARRLFPKVPQWFLFVSVLAFAFANPMLHGVTNAGTYHTAILSAQGWLLCGLLVAFDIVWYAGTSAERRWRLLAAGVCWSLSLASRVTVAPTLAVLIAFTALAVGWASNRRWLRIVSVSLWIGLPIAATGIALLAYNKFRFGSWTEFGLSLQLSGYPRLHFQAKDWLKYSLPNLYSYTLRPFVSSCQFPYTFQVWRMPHGAFPDGFPLPDDYQIDEPVIGWLRAVPITWLGAFTFWLVPRPSGFKARHRRVYLWCLLSFGAIALLTGLTGMGVYGATMRYLSDVTPGLVLFGLLGAMALRSSRLGQLLPQVTGVAFAVLGAATIVLGMLIGYQGYNGHFALHNPKLDERIVKALSVCGDEPANVPRYRP